MRDSTLCTSTEMTRAAMPIKIARIVNLRLSRQSKVRPNQVAVLASTSNCTVAVKLARLVPTLKSSASVVIS
jgi:hypothetical protein